jgi:hypothetical protein
MKLINLILVCAVGYVFVANNTDIDLTWPQTVVYLEKACPKPVQCPKIPDSYFTVETIENQICNGDIESFLTRQIKQVKVDVEDRLSRY